VGIFAILGLALLALLSHSVLGVLAGREKANPRDTELRAPFSSDQFGIAVGEDPQSPGVEGLPSKGRVDRVLFNLRTISLIDGSPVSSVTIRCSTHEDEPKDMGSTDGNGWLSFALERPYGELSESLTLEATAPGFQAWSTILDLREDSGRSLTIELLPLGRISLEVLSGGSPFTGDGRVLVTPDPPDSLSIPIRRDLEGANRVMLEGLRVGRPYRVLVSARGHRTEILEQVSPGWPEALELTVNLTGVQAIAVQLQGEITQGDCESIQVFIIAGDGSTGGGSRPRWDPGRGMAVAYPEFFDLDSPVRVLVRGPLGLTLADVTWDPSDGRVPTVALDLQRANLPLVIVGHETPPPDTAPLSWRCESQSGWVIPTEEQLRLLWTSSTPEISVDIRWGNLAAADVVFPRTEAVSLRSSNTGEVYVVGLPSTAARGARLINTIDGTSWHLRLLPSATEAYARVPAGTYSLLLGEDLWKAGVTVEAGESTTLYLTGVPAPSSLRVNVDRILPADTAGEWRVDVLREESDKLRLLASTWFPASDSSGVLHGLPSGAVGVRVVLPQGGQAYLRTHLTAGLERVLTPESWAEERSVVIRVRDSLDRPLEGLKLDAWLLPRGVSRVFRGETDADGQFRLNLVGGGSLAIDSDSRLWIEELREEQELVEISLPSAPPGLEQEVHFSGWWSKRVLWVAVLHMGEGPALNFATGTSSIDRYVIPDGTKVAALLVKLSNGLIAVLRADSNLDPLEFWEAPSSTRITTTADGRDRPPVLVEPRVIEIAGVNLLGTSFSRLLGPSRPLGEAFAALHALPMKLQFFGVAAQGGADWESPVITAIPGMGEVNVSLARSKGDSDE